MRRGQRNRWTYDNSPDGDGIVVVHNDMGQRREIHDLSELQVRNLAAKYGVTPKSVLELVDAGIIKL